MRALRKALSCGLVLTAVTVVCAQTAQPAAANVPPEQQASKEDVLRMMDAMHARESTRTMLVNMAEQTDEMTDSMVDQQYSHSSTMEKAKLKHDIKQLNNDILQQVFNQQFIDSMIDDVIPVYQRHFTKSDIDAIVGFYSSPAGQHFISEMPSLTLESMQAMMPKLEAQMNKVRELARKRAEEHLKKEGGANTSPKSSAPASKPPSHPAKPAGTAPPKTS